jgi:hypothetical protein
MGFDSLKRCIEEATKYISPVVANLLSADDRSASLSGWWRQRGRCGGKIAGR